MTNSVRKMLESKEAKRADAVHVRYESLHVEPGFNLRQQDDELEESIEALAQHIIDSGKYPPLEVRPRDDGGMWIVDGHRRHAAIGRALDRGAPLRSPKDGEAWIHVVLFEGNEEDRIARIITSAANKPLTPAEIAEGYKRLKAFGWTPAQIAKKVGRSAQHVQDLLALGNAPSPVREMVKAGQVSATRAAKAARKHGDKAAAVLSEQLQQAQAKGKKRITAATTDKSKASASEVEQLRAKVAALECKLELDPVNGEDGISLRDQAIWDQGEQIDQMRAELEALRQSSAVSSGRAVVPTTPDEAMRRAAQQADGDHGPHEDWLHTEWPDFLRVWNAMLTAAPGAIPCAEKGGDQR
ncbi:ParB/RepB/Spo0J family partition protein [Delftia deserti]|uniref:ParB/RepB/Spo0J family partition protein n=1 Tax=Delftia deserti TaxID=1651218 RepID=A0ABW5ETY7_9BURK